MAYRARKIGGSYQALGTVVAEFITRRRVKRVVFEFDEPAGMLHIFSPEQVVADPGFPETAAMPSQASLGTAIAEQRPLAPDDAARLAANAWDLYETESKPEVGSSVQIRNAQLFAELAIKKADAERWQFGVTCGFPCFIPNTRAWRAYDSDEWAHSGSTPNVAIDKARGAK